MYESLDKLYNASKNILKRLFLAIAVIIFISASRQILIEVSFNQNSNYTNIVNISGRQRMLSQKISKDVYGIYLSNDKKTAELYLEDLRNSIETLNKSNLDLKTRNSKEGLSGNNSKEIMALFSKLEPYHQLMLNTSVEILSMVKSDSYSQSQLWDKVKIIQDTEPQYLDYMINIVSRYIYEDNNRMQFSRIMSMILLLIIFIVLVFLILIVLKPAKKGLDKAYENVLSSYDTLLYNESLIHLAVESSKLLINSRNLEKSLLWISENLKNISSISSSFMFFNDEDSDKDNPSASRKVLINDFKISKTTENKNLEHFFYKEKGLIEMYNRLDSGNYIIAYINNFKDKDIFTLFKSYDLHSIILVPINNENSFVGFMGFATCKENQQWSSTEIAVLEAIASTIAIAIQNENYTIELEHNKEKAIGASKAKTNFLANMSHEIRNPLNAILGIVSILTEEALNAETKKYVRILKSSGESLLKIVNNVLDISKIEAGKIDIQISTFDLKVLVKEITYLFRESYKDKDVVISYVIDDALPEKLVGYGDGIYEIITNLASNSLKFTQTGYVNIIVNVKNIYEDNVDLIISVEDSGIGISKEELGKIFSTYTQANSSIKKVYAGTGLGLAISKSLVEFMGSDLKVESELGKGSKFFFNLALKVSNESVQAFDTKNTTLTQEDSLSSKSSIKVLLADDSQSNRLLIELYLKKYNCTLTTAENGQDALEKFKDSNFDIVFMDIQMPIMDGYTAVKKIREYENQINMISTPIIALTSYAFKDEIEIILSLGFTDHLAKPISKKLLLKTLDGYSSKLK